MADAFDPYGSGRERIRESVKWLYGVVTGMAAVLLATVSWNALPSLLAAKPAEGAGNIGAAAFALLACVIAGVGATLWALSSRPFGLGDLESQWSKVSRYEELFSNTVPSSFQEFKRMKGSDTATFQRVLSFGSYLDMGSRARIAQIVVAVASLIGAFALGALLQAMPAEKAKAPEKMEITLSQDSIDALAAALRRP